MLNLSVKLYLMAVNLIDFDPDIVDVIVSFFGVAGKYAIIIALCAFCLKMLFRAGTGKERFL